MLTKAKCVFALAGLYSAADGEHDEENKDVLYIHYDKNLYRKEGYHMCNHEYETNDGETFLVASIDDLHRDCLYNQPQIFLCLILHEYGHLVYKHNERLSGPGMTNDIVRDQRMACLLNGKVMNVELEADAFAIKHVGKNTFMRTMDYMIKKRKERINDPGKELAIYEFELRKKAAKKL